MDRLSSINAFVRVAEAGGFSAAARSLSVSTTTISDQVQALENALGVRLLNQGWGVSSRQSSLILSTGIRMCRSICGPATPDLVQEGFDLAIMPFSPADTTLVRRRLSGWHYTLCCSPGYLQKHAAPRTPADLADHNCLLYTYAVFGRDWPFIDASGNRVLARVSGNIVTNSVDMMRSSVLAGLGLWLVPPYIVADLLSSGALVPVLLDYGSPELEIVAVYPHRRHMTAKLRIFLDMLIDRFAEERRWLDSTHGE
jgi:DNA-binding transcriptional LysR family regulator